MTLNLLKWLHSGQDDLFDRIFVEQNPGILQGLSPLLILSVGASITDPLDTNIMERLAWLEAVLGSIDPRVSIGKLPLFSSEAYEVSGTRDPRSFPQNPRCFDPTSRSAVYAYRRGPSARPVFAQDCSISTSFAGTDVLHVLSGAQVSAQFFCLGSPPWR